MSGAAPDYAALLQRLAEQAGASTEDAGTGAGAGLYRSRLVGIDGKEVRTMKTVLQPQQRRQELAPREVRVRVQAVSLPKQGANVAGVRSNAVGTTASVCAGGGARYTLDDNIHTVGRWGKGGSAAIFSQLD
eukprot:CAMPEP_0195082118 /NCGR_PEP_ID=MMETSP0448-20130528/23386_1 /TAXON_ID=66468 /ORGANISM="Heterocapsa triquestra, Strain CCMP 448" /LENGTH=131 /DNA_ID=CAMNT_0040115195 /DNA_START=78 /DNA_END=473 /DNA_ORIENTATION=+